MNYRYHPIIENLKINEDGSEILLNGEPKKILIQQLKHTRKTRKVVSLGLKTINTIRLVCEAWHGVAPSGEHAARRVDENAGDHYSNLYWGKKGMTTSAVKGHKWNSRGKAMTSELYAEIEKRIETEKISHILKDMQISAGAFYKYRNTYVNKE